MADVLGRWLSSRVPEHGHPIDVSRSWCGRRQYRWLAPVLPAAAGLFHRCLRFVVPRARVGASLSGCHADCKSAGPTAGGASTARRGVGRTLWRRTPSTGGQAIRNWPTVMACRSSRRLSGRRRPGGDTRVRSLKPTTNQTETRVDNRDPHRGSKLFLATVPTDRDAAGPWTPGWLDWPVPTYVTDERGMRCACRTSTTNVAALDGTSTRRRVLESLLPAACLAVSG